MDQHVQPRARVGFIGAGRVARVLALASRSAGFDVGAPWATTATSRSSLAAELGLAPSTSVRDSIDRCDIVVVAVPDSQLASALEDLRLALEPGAAPLVVVTSGSADLEGAPAGDGRLVRIHPLHPFTTATEPADLGGVVAAVSAASPEHLEEAVGFARELGMAPFALDDGLAVRWHAAGCLAAGGVTTLLAIARDLAVDAGLDEADALQAMGALARSAIDNAVASSPELALTGPIVRGDVATVDQHVADLSAGPRQVVEAYRAVSVATIDLAVRAERLDETTALHLGEMLSRGGKVVGPWS